MNERRRYLIQTHKGHTPRGVAKGHELHARKFWEKLGGFSADLTDAQAARLAADPAVRTVELDGATHHCIATQLWGKDRLDQRSLPLDGAFDVARTGAGVTAYVLDTGINHTHVQFSGRVRLGLDVFGEGTIDQNGHGTHCAGTIGGATFGVAPGVSIVAVRVLNASGSGTWEGFADGCEWVANEVAERRQLGVYPCVVSVSLTGGFTRIANDAVAMLVRMGVPVCVAAGNDEADASFRSPASAPEVFTVGATRADDWRAWFSNFGSLIDGFAPGVGILSAWIGSDTASRELQGTSMACPHVAGVFALALEETPNASPAELEARIKATASQGVVLDSRSLCSDIVYARMDSVQPPDALNIPPVAALRVEPDPEGDPLAVLFVDESFDPDGYITRVQTAYGDGWVGGPARHKYEVPGTYKATETVWDNRGTSTSVEITVTVPLGSEPQPGPDPIPLPDPPTLTVVITNNRGTKTANLLWSGLETDDVDVFRNGVWIAKTPNNGTYSDPMGKKGKAPPYRVCEVGGSQCASWAPA